MSVFRPSGGSIGLSSGSGGGSQNFSLTGSGDVVWFFNPSTLDAFVAIGVGAQTATTSDLYVPAKGNALFRIGFADDNIAVKTPNSPTNLYVMRGSAD